MKLKFHKDTFYNGKIFASAGEIKEVTEENGFSHRWIRRGATVVSETKPEAVKKIVEAAPVIPEIEVKEEIIAAPSNESVDIPDFLQEDKPIAQEPVKGKNKGKNKANK